MLGESLLDRHEVVVGHGEGEASQSLGHAGRVGDAERGGAGTGGDQESIAMAVVAAFEFEDQRPSGRSAGEANRRHRRLRAGVDHSHPLEPGHSRAQVLGHLHLERGRRAVGKPLADRLLDRREYGGVSVTCNHRSPGTDVVEIALALDIPEIGPEGTGGEERLAAHRAEGADGGVDTAGDEALGAREQFLIAHGVLAERKAEKPSAVAADGSWIPVPPCGSGRSRRSSAGVLPTPSRLPRRRA